MVESSLLSESQTPSYQPSYIDEELSQEYIDMVDAVIEAELFNTQNVN